MPNSAPLPRAISPMKSALLRLRNTITQWEPDRHPLWLRLLAAVGMTLAAAAMRLWLAPAESGGRFITFALAAALAALYGGFRAGLLSTVLGMVMVNFLMVKPYLTLAIGDPREAIWLNTWHLLTQLLVVGTISVMQRQNRSLRQAVALARRHHRQLQDTFENSATGMAHTHIDGRWIRVNRTYCELIGYTPDEVLATNFRAYSHPEDMAEDDRQLKRCEAGEIDHFSMEKRYRHRQGHWVWVHLTVSLIRDQQGQPDYYIAVVQDISERKAAQEALALREELLRQAQLIARLATWQYDFNTRRFTALANSRELLGLPSDEYGEIDVVERTHPEDRARVLEAWHNALADVAPYDLECRMRLGEDDGWYSARAVLMRNEQGEAVRALGVLHDITARKRSEMALQELNATLEQRIQERTQALKAAYDELESYSYAVAHDLRSPLRIINGFAAALQEDLPNLPGDSLGHLARIMEASRKMGELIDGLLKLSQMARGDLQREPVNLSAIGTRLLRDLAATDAQREVQWSVQPGLWANADAALVEAVLQNLLHNAWKYTAHTPVARIELKLLEADGQRWFCVVDNGAGFDMARAAKLFQPFQRLHGQEEFHGLGIGLATAKRVVQRHGGELRADSAPGQGARFCFTLQPPPVGD